VESLLAEGTGVQSFLEKPADVDLSELPTVSAVATQEGQ
jgi:hypothetical protein